MADEFASYREGLSDVADNAAAVTPNDSTDLSTTARALYIGTGGSVKLDTAGGNTVTFSSYPSGTWLPVRTQRVYASGTTATGIVAVW
jgi:hypothetical protein